MSDDKPIAEDQGAVISFLIRKGRFAECMIVAYQTVEDFIDQMVAQEFELLYTPKGQDPRVDYVRRTHSLDYKMGFLKKMARLSADDIQRIKSFVDERNRLFHGYVFENNSPLTTPESEKTRLMELALKASQIATDRVVGNWVAEERGDIGNKDTPQPEKSRAVKWSKDLRSGHPSEEIR